MTAVQEQLVHVGYALMLLALLARDILWLRGILAVSQSTLACYAWVHGLIPIAFWNLVFVCINLIWVVRILRERAAVELPLDLKPLYERHFAALSPPEFLRLWSWGERRALSDQVLITEGTRPAALYFILRGEISILQGTREVARLRAGDFAGEMSLLTGEMATADARAAGAVELISWPAEKLAQLRARSPVLWTKLQSVLGHDLVEKIRRSAAATLS